MTDDRGYQEEYSGERPGRENKHSRMGIASFLLFVLGVLLFVGVIALFAFALAPIFQDLDPQAFQDPQSLQNPEDLSPELQEQAEQATPLILLSTLGLFGVPLLLLVGLGLGIGGLIQQRRKRLFAVLGTVLNGLTLFAAVALVFLTFVAGAGFAAG